MNVWELSFPFFEGRAFQYSVHLITRSRKLNLGSLEDNGLEKSSFNRIPLLGVLILKIFHTLHIVEIKLLFESWLRFVVIDAQGLKQQL